MNVVARSVANKIECFALDDRLHLVFSATNSGLLEVFKLPSFDCIGACQICAGGVNAIAIHPKTGLIACLGLDRTLTILKFTEEGGLSQLVQIDLRSIEATNDFVAPLSPISDSQALAWHPSLNRLATRNATSAVVELSIDEESWKILHCTRMHEDQDLVTVRYAGKSEKLLSGSIGGEIILSKDGIEKSRWQFGDRSIHWFEPLGTGEYLVASDTRCVGRLNLDCPSIQEGPTITLDDLEHVTYLPEPHTAYVCGFDKNLYLIDPDTCKPIRIVCRLPFKARWMSRVKWMTDYLLVQCYDGSLNLVNVEVGAIEARLHRTPPAIWTGTTLDSEISVYAGDTEKLLWKKIIGWSHVGREPFFDTKVSTLPLPMCGYIKRIQYVPSKLMLALGCTERAVLLLSPNGATQRVNLSGVLRDLCVDDDRSRLYCATEDGCILQIDLNTVLVSCIWSSANSEPVWALDFNADNDYIAFAERRGGIYLMSAKTGAITRLGNSSRPKRLKWLDSKKLLINSGDAMHMFDISNNSRKTVLASTGNTIEDFSWDESGRYLVTINYCCDLHLVDLRSGQLLHSTPDQIDYSKGILFLEASTHFPNAYPYHFLTFGRSGSTHLYRVHNDRLHALGPA